MRPHRQQLVWHQAFHHFSPNPSNSADDALDQTAFWSILKRSCIALQLLFIIKTSSAYNVRLIRMQYISDNSRMPLTECHTSCCCGCCGCCCYFCCRTSRRLGAHIEAALAAFVELLLHALPLLVLSVEPSPRAQTPSRSLSRPRPDGSQ